MSTTNTTDSEANVSAPLELSQSEKVSSRVYGGSLRCSTASDSVSQEVGITTVSSLSDVAAGSIMATMQTSYGSPTATMSPSTTVELEPGNPSTRTTLDVAERMGMVTRNALGIYEAVGQAALETPSEVQQDEAQGIELFSPAEEAQFASAIVDIPQALYDQAMVSAAASVAATGDIEDLASSLAATCGMAPSQLQEVQASATAMFQAQADKTISALGVNPSEFYDWARTHHGEKLGQAVRTQLTTRSVDGYRGLVKTYLDQVVPSLGALKAAGLETKEAKARVTNEMVFIHGTWMETKTAARIGLI